ncbi:MAG: helix-turn-helix domain-containing protein, partial [Muribaculaceae bacterium]|nr:helix-turn-helix domain-containing protein [Muribaculaceae bacterium]
YSITGRVSLFNNPVINATPDQAATFRNDINNIARRIPETDHLYYHEMIGSLCRTMIYDLFDFHTRHNENPFVSNRVAYVTKRFFSMIQEGVPAMHREPSFYAEALNVSVKYLSETIKRVTGDSVSLHINRAAVAIILEYLKDDNLSITQIADAMNFSSVQYFSRYCVKHLGNSPAKLR